MGVMRHRERNPSRVAGVKVTLACAACAKRVPLASAACQWFALQKPALLGALVVLALAGCGGTSTSPGRGGTGGNAGTTSSQQRAEILAGTMETLFNLEEYEFGQAEPLVMSRLNQWLRGQEIKIPWQREPRLDQLSAALTTSRTARSLAENTFLYQHDFEFLREAAWMRRISEHLRSAGYSGRPQRDESNGTATSAAKAAEQSPLQFASPEDPEELRLAMHLFDWTVSNVQLEDDAPEKSPYKLPRNWHTPYETVLLGRGTASDRAWTFILLGRQQGLAIVMLGIGDTEKPAELKPWIPALVLEHGDGDKKELDLYLFDPALGLPVPGPGGRGIATLAQVAADDALLRQLDLDDQRPYPIKSADIQTVTALVEASPGYLSHRMKFLESKLGGKHRLVLSVSPQAIEEKFAGATGAKGASHVAPRVVLWTRPYETLMLRQSEDETVLRNAQRELIPLTELRDRNSILAGAQAPMISHPAIKLWLNLSITRDEAVRRMSADGIPEAEITAALLEATKSRAGGAAGATSRREDATEWTNQVQRPSSRATPRVPLGVGRMMQLAGNFDHETGALRYLQQSIVPEAEQAELKKAFRDDLRARLPDNPDTRTQIEQITEMRIGEFRRADEAATVWIGQIKAVLGEFETAIDYFKRKENELWQPSINYSLARIYERQGKLDEAIALYREDDSPQRPGNLLRARRLERVAGED
jgi:tetratricopeptide (TPR) repeat protein